MPSASGSTPAAPVDLVQEALLRLWRELSGGADIRSPEAWTYRTLSRLAMDEHRLHRRIATLITRLGDRTTPYVMEDRVDRTGRRLGPGRPTSGSAASGHLSALPGGPLL